MKTKRDLQFTAESLNSVKKLNAQGRAHQHHLMAKTWRALVPLSG